MSNPSLLCVPYRFKTSKLYSQIPDSGLGDFTVTRTTTPTAGRATRVNAAGLIELVADNVPRLDYPLGGITAGCPSLLVEPSAQNLAVQSEDFTLSANWNTSTAGRTLVTGNVTATLDPYGGNVADLLSDDNTASNTHRMYTVGNISITSGTTYSTSFFVKANTTPWFEIRLMQSNEQDAGIVGTVFNLTSGTITSGSGTIQNYGNGWYRCTNIGTSNFTGNGRIFFYVYNSSGTKSYNGTSSNSLYIFGAQLETGSVATSYIPTTTAAVTRNADVVSVSGAVSGSIGQQSGTIYIECQSEFATNDIIVINTAGQSPGNNYVSITKTPTNVFRLTLIASGTTILIDQTSAITSFAKIAVAYASGNTALFINGTQIGSTNTTGFSFNSALNNITFISNMVSGTKTTRIRALALYTTRLPNTGPLSLQSLTQ